MDKKTALYNEHLAAHGKIVSYADYLLPIQYDTGILTEHHAVRNQAGIFDVSHMGEFILEGKDALNNLNYLLTNDFTDLAIQKARYAILCTEEGYAVDDLIVYKLDNEKYLLVVNASNCTKDFKWIQNHLFGDVEFTNISDEVSQIALQGPMSETILAKITDTVPEGNYTFVTATFNDKPCLISRTGYTGEDGFELYSDGETIVYLWKKLLEEGQAEGLIPCGLGCRDTLRLEAGMPLYGHELSSSITPLEAGLKPFLKMDKDFIGKDALEKEITRKKIGLVLTERGIARENYIVSQNGKEVGYITSGTFSPTLNQAIAIALVNKDVNIEEEFDIDVRGKGIKAERVKLPFYRKKDTK